MDFTDYRCFFFFYSGCLHLNISNTAHFLLIFNFIIWTFIQEGQKNEKKTWVIFLSQVLEKQTSLAVSQQFSVLISYFSFLL